MDLYRVTDPELGTLEPAEQGRKIGFCLIDGRIVDWHLFYQGPRGAYGDGEACRLPTGARMGLTAGWADIYRWSTRGNYVGFTGQPDGLYVVRAEADPLHRMFESDETDNSATRTSR